MTELYMFGSERFAPVVLHYSQYDYNTHNSNALEFRVKLANGRYYRFYENVWLIAARPDGVIYEIKGSVLDWNTNDRSVACFKLPKGITDMPGDVICEIVSFNGDPSISQASNVQYATQNFILRVEPSPKEIYGNNNTIIDDSGGGEAPYEPDDPADTPKYRIVVATNPTKTEYEEGEALDLTGVRINLEKYTDDQGVLETTDVTSSCTYQPANGATLTTSDTTVNVSYVK